MSGGASGGGGAARTTSAPYINQETFHTENTRQIHPTIYPSTVEALQSTLRHNPFDIQVSQTYTYVCFYCVLFQLSVKPFFIEDIPFVANDNNLHRSAV